jgi:hypothetical protein
VTRARTARCDTYDEARDRPCPGLLTFHPGDVQAACDTCGGWCGYLVAHYTDESVTRARCWCGRPVPPDSRCGCCCAEHDIVTPPKGTP